MNVLHFAQLGNTLATSGQPTADEFREIAAQGYRTVVNLALPSSTGALADEGAVVAGLGMTYVNVPVPWDAPQVGQFRRFAALIRLLGVEKVWVHCAMNMRVSCFFYLYRRFELGWAEDDARRHMDPIWKPRDNPVWSRFIDDVAASYAPPTTLLLDDDALRDAGRLLGEALADHQGGLRSRRVHPALDRTLVRRILDEPLPESARPWREIFREFRDEIVPNSAQIAHPRYLAYVLASPNGLSPFADAMAAALNQNCSLWEISPLASAIEQKVLAWFRELFGLPPDGGGVLTSGGSMANFAALAAARDAHLAGRDDGLQRSGPPLVLYASGEVHTSVIKAASLLGLGTRSVRSIETDEDLRMRTDALRAAVRSDRDAGFSPFCVVASAGSVATGSIDPLGEIAGVCRSEGLWLHVDGAYGAFAVLSERLAPRLREAGLADSLALDPHKLLFNSLEAGCVLYRSAAAARGAFAFPSSYLARPEDPDLIDFADYGPELSRSFRALKVWWALRTFGRSGYARTIDRLLDLAAHLARRVDSEPGLRRVAPVPLTAVCFEVDGLDANGHARLLRRLLDSGIAHLGPARVHGRPALRACITNLRTTESDLDQVVDAVVALSREA